MRILELRLQAFGPFTDVVLDLDAGEPGLQVVFGPNEAGKSSALRAITALLYGIGHQTSDDFIHRGRHKLRIGARLETAAGERLDFVRLKKRKDPLETPEGEVFDPRRLERALQGVSREQFKAVFGLDHASLSEGSLQLLSEGGEVGRALFSAGLGTADLRAVVEALDREASELFLPSGRKPAINRGLEDLAAEQRRLRELTLSGSEWTERREELETKRARLAEIDRRRDALSSRLAQYQRLKFTLGPLARRRRLLAERDALGEAPDLPPDAPERLREARDRIAAGARRRSAAADRLAATERDLASIDVPAGIRERADALHALHGRLEGEAEAPELRAQIEARRDAAAAAARRLLGELGPDLGEDDAPRLRALLGRGERLRELGEAHARSRDGIGRLEEALAETGRRRDHCEATLPEASFDALDAVARAVDAARAAGQLDERIAETSERLEERRRELARRLAELGPYRGTAEALETLTVPPPEQIRRHDAALGALRDAAEQARAERRAARAQREEGERRLEALESGAPLPDPEQWSAARRERDRGWELVKGHHVEGRALDGEIRDWAGRTPLPAAYEAAVRRADETAEALWRDAARLEQRQRLQGEVAEARAREDRLDARLEELGTEQAAADAAWHALWPDAGFVPEAPRDMEAWCARRSELIARLADSRRPERELAALREERDRLVAALAAALPERAGADGTGALAPWLERAERHRQDLQARCDARREAEADLDRTRREVDRLANELEAARREEDRLREEWRRVLGEDDRLASDPGEARSLVERLRAHFEHRDAADAATAELDQLRGRSERFAADVRALATAVAPELADEAPLVALPRLMELKDRANRLVERREHLEQQRREQGIEVEAAEEEIAEGRARLDELRRLAGVDDEAALEAAVERATRARGLGEELSGIEAALEENGDGKSLEALEAEAASVDADALPGLRAHVEEELASLEQGHEALAPEVWRLRSELDAMDGSDEAAALAESLASRRAGLVSDAGRYLRVRLAARVLQEEIERFRREHQGPVLERTSELFRRVTLGEFRRVRTELSAEGTQVLEAERTDGERLRTDAMSTGTRDQLYFALRLATLERFLDLAEPLPLVVEDLLVNFDDVRTREAIKVLGDLAAKTQVLLFTHHAHVVSIVRSALPGAQVLELPPTPARHREAAAES